MPVPLTDSWQNESSMADNGRRRCCGVVWGVSNEEGASTSGRYLDSGVFFFCAARGRGGRGEGVKERPAKEKKEQDAT